jgi:hypothetical protein
MTMSDAMNSTTPNSMSSGPESPEEPDSATPPMNPSTDSANTPQPIMNSLPRSARQRGQYGHAGATTVFRVTSTTITNGSAPTISNAYDHAGGRDMNRTLARGCAASPCLVQTVGTP